MTDPVEAFYAAALARARRRDAAIEEAVEESLTGGQWGVLVYTDPATGDELIGPHPFVPYGRIYYMPQGYPGGITALPLDDEGLTP